MSIKMLKKLRYLAIIVFLPFVVSLILFQIGKMSLYHMIIVNIIVSIIETIIFIAGLRIMAKELTLDTKISILKGKFDNKRINADTEILDKPIISTNPMKSCVFRIYIELAEKLIEPLEFSIIRIFEMKFSEQKIATLFVDGTHILYINVSPREKLNFKFNRDINAKIFSIDEIYTP